MVYTHRIFAGDEINKDEMVGECRRGEVHTGFWFGNMSERDLGIDGRIILIWIFKKFDGYIDWIDLTEGRNGRWAMR
jgi:hypothetical protein